MRELKDNYVFFICVTLLIICIFFIEKYRSEVKIDIQKNNVGGLGKVFYINIKRNFTDARYFYFYNGKRYESGEKIDNSGKEYLNKCFRIEFSSINPNRSNIFLNEEVQDAIKIKRAGF
nr:hypothetical protein [uncultured Flavobacterium sp.]